MLYVNLDKNITYCYTLQLIWKHYRFNFQGKDTIEQTTGKVRPVI